MAVVDYTKSYLASILLPTDAYEAELNAQLLGALRESGNAPEIAAPIVLPGPANRIYFVETFLAELSSLAFGVEIVTPEPEIAQQIDFYEDGRPDPGNPASLWRVMNLDLRVDLGGWREAKLFIRELPSEDLVLINFAFVAGTVRGAVWHRDANRELESELPSFRVFLLALAKVYPVLIGSLGLELVAPEALGEYEVHGFYLPPKLSLPQLTSPLRPGQGGSCFDFVIISPGVAGSSKPLVFDGIKSGDVFKDIEALGQFHDLSLVEDLRRLAEQAEAAYDRMYEAIYPKADRDEALGFLADASGLAGVLGFVDLEAELKQRYEHINAVYNSQFRR